jgi:ribosomal protein S18 acetylase RimI-like enzyme
LRDVLARFDAEMRVNPPPNPGDLIQTVDGVVRVIGDEARIELVDFKGRDIGAIIHREREYFSRLGRDLEWKVYGHDMPPDLGERLKAAGFIAEPVETFMILDLLKPIPPVPQADIRRVVDEAMLRDFMGVANDAFSEPLPDRLDQFRARLHDETFALFLVYQNNQPASTGRLEMPSSRAFASLWSGGTSPAYRKRGLFQAVIGARAAEAKRQGYAFLTVDARDTSADSDEVWFRASNQRYKLDIVITRGVTGFRVNLLF